MQRPFWGNAYLCPTRNYCLTPFDIYFTTAFVLNLTNPAPYLIKFVNFVTGPRSYGYSVRLFWANARLILGKSRLILGKREACPH